MILISIVLALVAIFFHTPILNLINCPKEAMDQASAYMVTHGNRISVYLRLLCRLGNLAGDG